MSRTRLMGKTRFGTAAHLLLAVLFALHCQVAWGATGVRTASAELTRTSLPAARRHATALVSFSAAPAKCEATNDDPQPPGSSRLAAAPRSILTAAPLHRPTPVWPGAPAPPPPARGPPVQTA